MKPKTRRISLVVVRISLGLIFLLSGIGKLINSSDAQYMVELLATKYYWLIEYTFPIVLTISIIELLIATFLLWEKQLKIALSASLVMLLMFSSVLGYFYLQGMNVASCGCFGAFGIGGGIVFSLLKNLVLIALVITAFILSYPQTETISGEPQGVTI